MTTITDRAELEKAIKLECQRSGQDYEKLMTASLKGLLAELRFKQDCKGVQPYVKSAEVPHGND